jgi:hypothetical protein
MRCWLSTEPGDERADTTSVQALLVVPPTRMAYSTFRRWGPKRVSREPFCDKAWKSAFRTGPLSTTAGYAWPGKAICRFGFDSSVFDGAQELIIDRQGTTHQSHSPIQAYLSQKQTGR